MPKVIPDCPAVPAGKRTGEERGYHIELLTPLFGGGVEAGTNDPTLPIRTTAIRGQLQFWWRATRGAAFASVREMRQRHAEVWGATDRASPVSVAVADVQASPPQPCAQHRWDAQARKGQGGWRLDWQRPFDGRDNALPYFLFPFQGQMPENNAQARAEVPPGACIHRASFTLRVRFPAELQADVETAIWAWVHFGGLGARTRRGCGALRCDELAATEAGQLGELHRRHAVPSEARRGWPTLPARLLVRTDAGDAIEVWRFLAGLFRRFRQGEGFARNPGRNGRPGRSRYPEPESLREALRSNRGQSGHQRLPQIPADAFPRAEFGLPIVFHFQGRGEPADTTLQPPGAERMASPLIIKPLALKSGRTVPLILPLLAPGLDGVELLLNSRVVRSWDGRAVCDPSLATYPGSPLDGLSSRGSVMEAFLNFARRPASEDGPGFVEIAR